MADDHDGSAACRSFLSVGGLVGFLFGILRTVQQTSGPANQQTVNTNLEQISDWLTKILVGVGLTQLRELPSQLRSLAVYFGGPLGASPDGEIVAWILIVNSAICGFLAGYLFTRLFLAGEFSSSGNES